MISLVGHTGAIRRARCSARQPRTSSVTRGATCWWCESTKVAEHRHGPPRSCSGTHRTVRSDRRRSLTATPVRSARQVTLSAGTTRAGMKIVVGYDGSAAAKRALERAATLASDPSHVVVMVAVPYPRSGITIPADRVRKNTGAGRTIWTWHAGSCRAEESSPKRSRSEAILRKCSSMPRRARTWSLSAAPVWTVSNDSFSARSARRSFGTQRAMCWSYGERRTFRGWLGSESVAE